MHGRPQLIVSVDESPLEKDLLPHILACMADVNRIILETGSFEASLERVLDAVKNIVGAEGAGLLLYDEESQCLELQKPAFGSYDDRLIYLYRVSMADGGNAVQVFQSGQPYLSNNVPEDPRFLHHITRPFGVRNIVSVPVTVGNKCIGVFHVINKPEGFSGKDVEVITLLVSQLAVAVANARLICQVRTQETRARALYELSMEFNLRDFDHLARLVPRKICSILPVSLVAIAIADSSGKGRIVAEAGMNAGMAGRLVPIATAEAKVKYLEESPLNELEAEAARLGMVTQLTMPVQSSAGVLGELWVWSDRRRHFSHSERRFLSLVTRLLAMAMENASLYQREKDAASRLQRYLELNEQLVRLVLDGAGVQRITDSLARFLGAGVIFSDRRLVKRAWAPNARRELQDFDPSFIHTVVGKEKQLLSPAVVTGSLQVLRRDGDAQGEVMVAPVEIGGKTLGYLFVLPPVSCMDDLLPVIQRVLPIYALEMLKEQIADEVLRNIEGDFVVGLLHGKYSEEEILRRASSLGYDLTRPLVVMVAEYGPGTAQAGVDKISSWRLWLTEVGAFLERFNVRGLAVALQEQLVILISCECAEQLKEASRLRAFAGKLRDELVRLTGSDIYVGIGRPVQRVTQAKGSYQDACLVIEYLRRTRQVNQVLAFNDLGLYQVLAYDGASEYLFKFACEFLGPLLEMDRLKRKDYLKTLDRYFASDCSLKATAEALYCHVNTVRYRLERIKQMLSLDVDNVEQRFTLEMALKLLKFRFSELF